jgi:hypothetical protein
MARETRDAGESGGGEVARDTTWPCDVALRSISDREEQGPKEAPQVQNGIEHVRK